MPIIKPRGEIKEIIGKSELAVNGQTLKEVFTYLSKVYHLASEPSYIIIVNGQMILTSISDSKIKLKGSDVIDIIPPVAGG